MDAGRIETIFQTITGGKRIHPARIRAQNRLLDHRTPRRNSRRLTDDSSCTTGNVFNLFQKNNSFLEKNT